MISPPLIPFAAPAGAAPSRSPASPVTAQRTAVHAKSGLIADISADIDPSAGHACADAVVRLIRL